MGYSPCIGANFGPYENALVFWIWDVFCSCFLQERALMWSSNRFLHLLAVFNFWPKLTILHGLYPMYSGQFWPFLKCSHFSNIRCFLERFFAHNIFNVVAQWFAHLSAVFNFWPKLTILHGLYPIYRGQFWPFLKCSQFFEYEVFSGALFCTEHF